MKRKSSMLLLSPGEETVKGLSTGANKILAEGLKKSSNPVLSTADLWYIQRQRRIRLSRRYL